jgi:hypothetical protein
MAPFQARPVASGSVVILLSAFLRLSRPRRGACNGPSGRTSVPIPKRQVGRSAG